jgi:hypothetical protein
MLPPYSDDAPERAILDATGGLQVVEFGSKDCGNWMPNAANFCINPPPSSLIKPVNQTP